MSTSDSRRVVVTGAGSGMGLAVSKLLQQRGNTVFGIDIRNAEVLVDLSSPDGRLAAVAAVRKRFPTGIDALIPCAGISTRNEPKVAAVNFFGTTEIVDALHPELLQSRSARVVIISSFASIMDVDEDIVKACLDGDEPRALKAAAAAVARAPDSPVVYTSSKRALTLWIRNNAVRSQWAGSNILMNGIAPGTVDTPMMQAVTSDPAKLAQHRKIVPVAVPEIASPESIAQLLVFLSSAECPYLAGQVIFVDGGAEAIMRPDRF